MDFEAIASLLDFGFAAIMAFYLVAKTTTAINNLTMQIQHQTSILIYIAGKIKGVKGKGNRQNDYNKMLRGEPNQEPIYNTAS